MTARRRTAAVIALGCAVAVLTSCATGAANSGAPARSASARPPTQVAPSQVAPSQVAPSPSRDTVDAATSEIARLVQQVPDGAAAVSVRDIDTGRTFSGGHRGPLWSASTYKLLVLEALLYAHGPLDGQRLEAATAMIESSDNEAGYDLFLQAGGDEGLRQMMDVLGMTQSTAGGSDPAFTRLTADDAVRMLRALVEPGVLPAAAQRQARRLMRHVQADQQWGVGAVADPGTEFANKNGWLSVDDDNPPGERDGGRWVVDSVGIVVVGGHRLLIAALSEHHDSLADGISVIEALVRNAAAVVRA